MARRAPAAASPLPAPLTLVVTLLLALPLSLLPSPAAQALPFELLARTRLLLQADGDSEALVVRARLVDDLGQGLTGRTVTLQAGDQQQQATSRADGALPRWTLALPPGEQRVVAEFAGDDQGFEASRAELTLRLELPRPRLTLELPPTLAQGEPLTLTALAELHGRPLPALPLELRLDGRPRGPATTDEAGQAFWRVAADELGGPGAHTVEVAGAAGARRQATRAQAVVVRRAEATLLASGRLEEQLLADRVVLQGRLQAAGVGLGGRPLGIGLAGAGAGGTPTLRPLAGVASEADGRFRWQGASGGLPAGLVRLQVRYPGEPGIAAVQTVVEVQVPAARAPSPLPQLLAVALSALLVGATLARRPLAAAGRWLGRALGRGRWAGGPGGAGGAGPGGPAGVPLRPAFSLLARDAIPTEAPTTGGLTLVGLLWDRVTDQPVEGGKLTLRRAGAGTGAGEGGAADAPVVRTASRADGLFVLTAPAAGAYLLEGRAAGYVGAAQPLSLPWAAGARHLVRLGLLPVREAVRELWLQRAARRHPVGRRLWGRDTPAEVLSSLATVPTGFAALTALLERVWYGRGPHDETQVERARRLAAGEDRPGRDDEGAEPGAADRAPAAPTAGHGQQR